MRNIQFFLAFLLILFCYSKADDGFFRGEGATVIPMNNEQIELVKETVNIHRVTIGYNKYWVADCEFVFRNTGPKVEVQMGFPDYPKGAITNFKSLVDDSVVETGYKEVVIKDIDSLVDLDSLGFKWVYTWKVDFSEGEMKTLRSCYEFIGGIFQGVPYLLSGHCEKSIWYEDGKPPGGGYGGTSKLVYVVQTGALWKGKIDTADIYVNLGGIHPANWVFVCPFGYTYKDSVVEWHFRDFEPQDNITIEVVSSASPFFDTVKQARKWIEVVKENEYSKRSVMLVRNFIYAKYGKPFGEKWLRNFFENYIYWSGAPYRDEYEYNFEYSDTLLTETDREIEKLLLELENSLE